MVCIRFFDQGFRLWKPFSFRLVLASWLGIFGGGTLVFGAEWSIEPVFHSEGKYYENLLLTAFPHHATWAMKVSPAVGMTYATEILNLKASPKFEHAQYFSQDPIDKTFNNYFLPFSGSYRTEVDRFGVDAAIHRDNSLLAELQETGVVTNLIPRNFRNVRGSWDRSLTERMTAQSSYRYTDVSYNQKGNSSLRDYQVHAGTVGADFAWTEELHVHGTASYANYYVSQNGFRAHGPGLELGFAQRIFETLSLSGSGGLRYVRTTLDGNGGRITDNNLLWLFQVAVDKEWERSHLTVGFSRTLNPSGIGVLFATNRIDLGVDHHFTHALKGSLRGTFTSNDTVGSSSDVSGVNTSRRVYWNVGPTVSWRVTEDWALDFSYGYVHRKVSGVTAHSNNVMIGVTYRWPKWAVSH